MEIGNKEFSWMVETRSERLDKLKEMNLSELKELTNIYGLSINRTRWNETLLIDREYLISAISTETGGNITTTLDNDVLEIWGFPISQTYDPESKIGYLNWKDLNDKDYKIPFKGQTHYWRSFKKLGFTDRKIRDKIIKQSATDQKKITERLFSYKHGMPLLLRAGFSKEFNEYTVFGIMTKRWKKITVKDLEPYVHQALKDSPYSRNNKPRVSTKHSNGRHGGRIKIQFKELRPGDSGFVPTLNIDAGYLNAEQAVKGWGGARILMCSNQLSTEVRSVLGKRLKIAQHLFKKKEHIDKPEAIQYLVQDLVQGLESLSGLMDTAIETYLSPLDVDNILDYYTGVGFISTRVRNQLGAKMMNNNYIGSDLYGSTLYGLMMAVTEFGPHANVKKGVAEKCIRMGGELTVVAPYWDEYMELILPTAQEYRGKMVELEDSFNPNEYIPTS